MEMALSREGVEERDALANKKGKESEDGKRGTKESDIRVGDHVIILNNIKPNKLTPNFKREVFIVVNRTGPKVTGKWGDIRTKRSSCEKVTDTQP